MRYVSAVFVACIWSIMQGTVVRAETAAPEQQHHADSCKEEDEGCKLAWWEEYKPALIAEFVHWSAYKGAAESSNPTLALNDINDAIVTKNYRHHVCDFYKGFTGIKGVDQDEIEAVVGGCRTAIIDMKYWLISTSDGRAPGDDPRDFEKNAKWCVTAMGSHHPRRGDE